MEGGLVGGLRPTLRKGAKDGAPGVLWLVAVGRGTWLVDGLHPTLRKSAKDGAPGVLWLVEDWEMPRF